jgi:alpha-galactosidase
MLDLHMAAELDLDQIWALVNDLIAAHGEWIPKPLRTNSREITAKTDRTGVAIT